VVTPAKRPQSVANSSAAAQYGHKVTICHKGHTISVDEHAVPAHRKHGDTIGPCPTGAVAGANAALTNGRGNSVRGGVLGTTARGGNLPFTGASLGVAVVVALVLITCGIALRRRARRS
jgi:hypothetical protein